MLTKAQQRGRLRVRIIRELKRTNLRRILKDLLKENNQDVTGFLQRSISATRYDEGLSTSYTFDGDILQSVSIELEIPWGRYGKELDSFAGRDGLGEHPEFEQVLQWARKKRIPTQMKISKQLKSGENKTYTYTNTESSRKAFAYNTVKKIIRDNEVQTRYEYRREIEFELNAILSRAVFDFYMEEIGEAVFANIRTKILNFY